ncbi:hypothetical protein BDN70DRAFT_808103 [Pholiota conissans]|uniref:DUF7727 domain-containing protein n=1 Tax=Pholiota conissans TaxID=109636 RepID=A0A9P6CT08_9AGAR|nr:hypothetical protein BDN70DRAFT_808103 [Pholiota conissans]
MGNLIWHEYTRLISITANICEWIISPPNESPSNNATDAVWAAFFGLFYRKFFWDFVGGTLRDPGGLQPSPNAALFVTLIVKAPIIQIISMILGFIILAIELPLPAVKQFSVYRSLVVRVVLLLFQTFFSILFYQGTNAAIWSLIAAMCYGRAIMLGETMTEAKKNRGRGGEA